MPKTFLKAVRRTEQDSDGRIRLERNRPTRIGNTNRYDLSAHDDWSVVSELSVVTRWHLGKIPQDNQDDEGRKPAGKGLKILPKIKSSSRRRDIVEPFVNHQPSAIQLDDSNRKVFCSHCSKAFPDHCALQDHLLIHLKENARPFVCPKCPRTFSDRSNMLSHQRTTTHHDWKWICQRCDKPFSEPKYLKRHCNRFHPQSPKS